LPALRLARIFEQLTAGVQVGDFISRQLFGEDLANSEVSTPSSVALENLQLTIDDLSRLLAKTQAAMEKVKAMLEI
jgi:hypothetical protein